MPTQPASIPSSRRRSSAAVLPLEWRRSRVDRSFPRLGGVDPLREGLAGVPGVVLLWARGADGREVAVYAGQTSDLAAAVLLLRDDPALAAWEPARLCITWAPMGVAHRAGVVTWLRTVLRPAVSACLLDARWPVRPNAGPLPVALPL